MRNFIKIRPAILLLALCIGCIVNGCKEETPIYGDALIYMPQATVSGGVTNRYLVPSGGGDMTYNFVENNGKIDVILGVRRSGTMPSEDFAVTIAVDESATASFVQSGAVADAVAMPAGSYSLPSNVSVSGSNDATFYLSIDSAMLISDLAFTGQKWVLAVGIENPTNYELSATNNQTLIIVDVEAMREHYFQYKEDVLYRKGSQLMLNGRNYQSVGINGFALSGCGSESEAFSEAEIETLFASLPNNTLVRTWAFPGNKAQTDKIIKAAERNNIKLILTLGDSHRSCGDDEIKNEAWYTGGFRDRYLAHAKDMATTYKDSPAIGMWEMLNEPTFWDAPFAVIKSFYNEVAKELKTADPNHLVSTGSWAPWAYGDAEGFRSLHHSNYIDVGTLHDGDQDIVESWHFGGAAQAMGALNKVLLVSDIGIEGGDTDCFLGKDARAGRINDKFNLYLSKGVGAALASSLVKTAPSDCSRNFGLDDPILTVVKTHPANASVSNL